MHLSTLGRLALLLALLLAPALALPTAKDAKFFRPSADDPSVTDLGRQTGRIGIDIVDPSILRVDPVRVIENIARSSARAAALAKRGEAPLEEDEEQGTNEGEEGGRAARRSHIQVDPVEVDVHVVRPTPHKMPSNAGQQPETAETGRTDYRPAGLSAKYLPKFRPGYDAGEWVRHY